MYFQINLRITPCRLGRGPALQNATVIFWLFGDKAHETIVQGDLSEKKIYKLVITDTKQRPRLCMLFVDGTAF